MLFDSGLRTDLCTAAAAPLPMTTSTILIVGGTRGLGAALASAYAAAGASVYTTARSAAPPSAAPRTRQHHLDRASCE